MNVWALIMLGAAVLIFVAVLVLGRIAYNPNRARNVKYAERAALTAEHLIKIQASHPEIVKVPRADRHPWFIGIHICAFGYALSVFSGARLTSNVLTLGEEARYTMATCFLVGSLLVLIGVTLGAKIGPWRIMPSVSDHLTASALGDDIVLSYRLEMAGMSAMLVSSSIYSWTSFQSTTGSLGGWYTGGIAVLCGLTVISFYRAVEVFQNQDRTLITETQARLEAGDGSAFTD